MDETQTRSIGGAGGMTPETPARPPTARTRPSNRHTCGGCRSHWTGLRTAHCAACHETFSGGWLFDQHRRSGRCVDPRTLPDVSLRDGEWRRPEMTDDEKHRRFGKAT